jgi:hypothetical protein
VSDRLGPILEAVKTKAAGLGLVLGGAAAVVLVRKAAVRRQTMDPKHMITVSKSATPEAVSRWTFGKIRTDYRVDIVVHSPFAGPDADQTEFIAARDTLVDAFSRPPLPGADGVFDLRAEPADWLRPFGEETQWDWQALVVTASVVSPNGG